MLEKCRRFPSNYPKKKRPVFDIAALLLLSVLSLFGQEQAPDPEFPNFRFEVVNLPGIGNEINIESIVQDSTGFLWLATGKGLLRYDGHRVKQFLHNPRDTNTISGNDVSSLYLDKSGYLWVGTYGSGLNRMDLTTEKFARYTPKGHYVHSIIQDRDQMIWTGSYNSIIKLDPQTRKAVQYPVHVEPAWSLFIDSKDALWVGGMIGGPMNGGLLRYQPEKDQFTSYSSEESNLGTPASNSVYTVFEDSHQQLWIGTVGEGLYQMNRETESFVRFAYDPKHPNKLSSPIAHSGPQGSTVAAILEDLQGNLWIGSIGGGLNYYDTNLGRQVHFEVNNAPPFDLPDNNIWRLYQSADSVLWIGTGRAGNKFIKGFREDNYIESHLTELGWRKIRSLYQDSISGELWIGIPHALILYDLEKGIVKQYDYPDNVIYRIAGDQTGRLWLSFSDDTTRRSWLSHFDPATETFSDTPKAYGQFPDSFITDILTSQGGDIWIATNREGIRRYDASGHQKEEYRYLDKDRNSIAGDQVRCLYEDSHGKLWIGGSTDIDGQSMFLDRFDPETGSFSHITFPHDYPTGMGTIHTIQGDQNGVLWLATSHLGVIRFDPAKKTFDLFNAFNSTLPTNDITAMVLDQDQHLWIAIQEDIFRFNPENGQFLQPVNIRNQGDLLGQLERKRAIALEDGTILFGCQRGFISLNPDKFKPTSSLQLKIVDFRLLDANGPKGIHRTPSTINNPSGSLTLSHRENSFAFRFFIPDFRDPAAHRFEYMLEPYDADWRTTEAEPEARFYQITPGHYRFRVRGYGPYGIESEEKSISITVTPPWWKTRLAYFIYLLFFITSIWSYIRWRTNAFRKRSRELEAKVAQRTEELAAAKQLAEEANEAKSTFLSTVSHELRTPLTSIIGFSKLNQKSLRERIIPAIKEEEPKAQKAAMKLDKNLDVVASEGERLTHLINELLDLAKIEAGKVEWKMVEIRPVELIEQATAATSALFEQKPELELITEIPDDLPSITGDRDRLLQVLINLISNAVKFTDSGAVTLGVKISPSGGGQGEEILKNSVQFAFENSRSALLHPPPEGARGSELVFFVQDTGSGIPPEHLEQIFEKFKQVADNQTGKPMGTGLGLPICKEIVEHHGGRIWVESTVGSGSCFYFSVG